MGILETSENPGDPAPLPFQAVVPGQDQPLALPDPSAVDMPSAASPDTPRISSGLPVVEVHDLDWQAVRCAADAPAIRARMHTVVEQMEALLDRAGGPGLLFDADRLPAGDRAIQVSAAHEASPLWVIGDLHGDLLALEAALAQIRAHAAAGETAAPHIIFLGDFFDDEGYGL